MMSNSNEWAFPESMQPKQDELAFDLEPALDAMVGLKAEIPTQAFTANTLGTTRTGSGVVLDDRGTVLTIGYLISEAQTVFLTTRSGRVVQAVPLAYDQATGLGLLKALGPLDSKGVRRGDSRQAKSGDAVYLLGHGGLTHALSAKLADKRPFAGYWEYLLESALFTLPVHPHWSGAGLFNAQGELIGVGSLMVQDVLDGEESGKAQARQGNMVVPIEILEPILADLISTGQSGVPARPWLGLYAGEVDDQVVVGGIADQGPAKHAGVRQDDLILDVAGTRVHSLATFLRAVWALGPAGVQVPLTLGRDGELVRVKIQSADRNALLYRPTAH
jgi:S1-C subfamily serine protease